MSSGYPNQPPYPGVAFPALQPAAPLPERPGKPWPLRAVNRWMTIGAVVITLLAVLLAVLAPRVASDEPSTAGMKLAYQSSLTRNDSGQMSWDEAGGCQFTSSGYVVTAPDANHVIDCTLRGSSFQNFTLHVHIVYASEVAFIGFLAGDRLAIYGSGRFAFHQIDPQTNQINYLYPQTRGSVGTAALHNTDLGVSERGNDITIQVQGLVYSFYANGQLLTTYNALNSTENTLDNAGPISLGASGQAEFSDIAIYTPG
jgi:hypothetical protein